MTKLVIFDCDGVLVDSEGPTNEVLSRNLARYGLTLAPQDCNALFVGGTMAGVGDRVRQMGTPLPDDWIDEIYGEVYARLAEGIDPIEGIFDVLDRLDTVGLPYCVASNGSLEKMRITLGQSGLWNRFEGAMFSAHELGVAKPDPGLFLAAARHFDMQPQDCLVVEDSASGVTAAARAGMPCVAYAAHGDGAALRALGAEPIHHMRELLDRFPLA
ncbi:MAG: HAD family hydrolase [Paracoccaceae bacterium]